MDDDVLNGGPRAHNLREIVARGWMVHKERNGERRLGRELLWGSCVRKSLQTLKAGMVMAFLEKKGGFNMFQHQLKGRTNEVE